MSRRLRLFPRRGRASPDREPPDAKAFATRHRFVLVILLAQVPALAAVGLFQAVSIYEIVVASLLLVVLAVVGLMARSNTLAATVVALGLITAAGILVRYLDGSTASQFAFYLAVVAISFYQDRKLLLTGLVYVVAYHLFAVLVLYRDSFTSPTPGADPVSWPATQLGFSLILVLLLMAGWRVTKRTDASGTSDDDSFRVSFEKAPVGMAVLTPSGEFLHVNGLLGEILGYEPGKLVGAGIRSIIHGDDLGDLGQAWEDMGNGATRSTTTWMRCLTGDGQGVWARLSLSLVPGAPKRPATVLLQLEDGSGAHQEQIRLENLNREKDEFVAAVGEDIRAPIGSILDLTAEAYRDPADLHHIVRQVESEAKAAAAIVDDLITSALADTVPVSVVARTLDAELLCQETLAGVPGAEKIPVEVRAASLWADPALTERVLASLVSNAIRYGGYAVAVRTTSSGPDTVIQVIDDGPEIPVSERERIFNGDLRRGQPVTKPAAAGLSLTVARHLAHQMDGDIVYRRSGDGHNIFELRLPSEQIGLELDTEPVRIPA
jgi:PAS domain S-box-containing protein